MSRSHATSTRRTDYVGVLEEAAGLLDRAECHEIMNLIEVDEIIE